MGYMLCATTVLEWIIFAVATTLLFFPSLLVGVTGLPDAKYFADFIGMALWGVVYLMQKARIKRDPTLILPIDQRRKLRRAAA